MSKYIANLRMPNDDKVARDLSLKWGRIVSPDEVVQHRKRLVDKVRAGSPSVWAGVNDDDLFVLLMDAEQRRSPAGSGETATKGGGE